MSNVLFLVSGEGALFQTAINAARLGLLPATILGAIADRPCRSLERARAYCGVAELIDYSSRPSGSDFQKQLIDRLRHHRPDCIFMTFNRLVSPAIIDAFPHRILNMHPGLLPAFPRFKAIEQAAAFGARYYGCTVHFADAGTDTGPQIIQAALPLDPRKSIVELHQALFPLQTTAMLQSLRWFTEGKIRVEGRRVDIAGARFSGASFSPDAIDYATLPDALWQNL